MRSSTSDDAAASCEAIAICFLFSFRNAAHEIRAAELIRENLRDRRTGDAIGKREAGDFDFGEFRHGAQTALRLRLLWFG